MAYVSNMQDDEEPKAPSQGAVPPAGGAGSAGVQLAPSSGVGSAGGASAPSQPGQPAAGGSFATLDKYISANQGQAQPLANKITSGIGKEYDTLAGQNASTLADVGSQVTAGSAPSNANAIIAQEAANPVSFAGDQGNVNQFKSLLNATYAGPASAESTPGFTTQQNAVNSAIAAGKNATTTEAGRSQLLAKNEAAPSTSVTGLNSAILSQNPESLSQVENAYKPFQNLVTGLSTGATGINQNISRAQNDAATANAAANKQIADQTAALNSRVNANYNDLQGKYTAANTAASTLASDLQGGKLPTGYGVDPRLQTYMDTIINPWVTSSIPGQSASYNFANAVPEFTANTPPMLAQAATAEDYSQAQAFQNLLAGINTGIAAPIINSGTANQAGTYNTAVLPTVNNNTLASDIYGGVAGIPGHVSAPAFQRFNNILSALDAYQGKWTPRFGSEPAKGTQDWRDWSYYHGGPGTAQLQDLGNLGTAPIQGVVVK